MKIERLFKQSLSESQLSDHHGKQKRKDHRLREQELGEDKDDDYCKERSEDDYFKKSEDRGQRLLQGKDRGQPLLQGKDRRQRLLQGEDRGQLYCKEKIEDTDSKY